MWLAILIKQGTHLDYVSSNHL